MTKRVDIFLSYARGDDEHFVRNLYEDLTTSGFTVWWARVSMLNQNIDFLEEIRQAIESCDLLIAVIGPKAVDSYYVQAELRHALLLSKKVVPIFRLKDYELVPPDLMNFRCSDCLPSNSYAEVFGELCQIL